MINRNQALFLWKCPSFDCHFAQVWSSLCLLCRGPDGADGGGPVGEGVPQALDAGAVGVEGLPDADDVQAGLIGQLGHEL